MTAPLKKTRIELNNAVFSLPDIVAKKEGYFIDEGVDVELVLPEKRKAMIAAADAPIKQHSAIKSFLWHEGIEKGEFSVYHACEWGQMRRTQDTCAGVKVITKRAAVSTQASVCFIQVSSLRFEKSSRACAPRLSSRLAAEFTVTAAWQIRLSNSSASIRSVFQIIPRSFTSMLGRRV